MTCQSKFKKKNSSTAGWQRPHLPHIPGNNSTSRSFFLHCQLIYWFTFASIKVTSAEISKRYPRSCFLDVPTQESSHAGLSQLLSPFRYVHSCCIIGTVASYESPRPSSDQTEYVTHSNVRSRVVPMNFTRPNPYRHVATLSCVFIGAYAYWAGLSLLLMFN